MSLRSSGAKSKTKPSAPSAPSRKTTDAYDGGDITERDMRWTRVLRALIHRDAQSQPAGGPEQAVPDHQVYLSGRGRIREHGSWAEAHPSIHDDLEGGLEDYNGVPLFRSDAFRFHVYQELDRNDGKFRISSIPFHEECWDIFMQAIQAARTSRLLPAEPEPGTMDLDVIWAHLCSLIPTAVTGDLADLTVDATTSITNHDRITRLAMGCMGNGGYREAQDRVIENKWVPKEGLHWLVAKPQQSGLSYNPFQTAGKPRQSRRPAKRASTLYHRRSDDPFWRLPEDVLIETVKYLTCREYLRWRTASSRLRSINVRQKDSRRFFVEDMAFLPTLIKQMEDFERSFPDHPLDWRRLHEEASLAWRKDDGLRNRRRIWKIVQPMADELVERSDTNLQQISGIREGQQRHPSVVRGNVGATSGAEGNNTTIMFGHLFPETSDIGSPNVYWFEDDSSESSDLMSSEEPPWIEPERYEVLLETVHVWTEPGGLGLHGLGFVLRLSPVKRGYERTRLQIIGKRTADVEHYRVDTPAMMLIGFNVCWYDGRVRGVQFVLEDTAQPPSDYISNTTLSPRFGLWDGPIRHLIAPRLYRNLTGITGFVNSSGFIETFALLEGGKVVGDGQLYPPPTVPLSHQEASMWREPPPYEAELLTRQGPVVGDWRLRACEWEVFRPCAKYLPAGTLTAVEAYIKEDYVAGLGFHYQNKQGQMELRHVGFDDGEPQESFELTPHDELRSVIISWDNGGVRSLQVRPTCLKDDLMLTGAAPLD
ncbi:MAG: hypothetical protein M1817_006375 [Caeruleum heppii]|nr:MAG: hypothetical protein M1817_006375 [Caeruleum heppii]